ncbi:DsrE family protein [Thermosulfurimonas sp. F29]|uniref:DsrE family protein n=1 Tax=Thermosulfurimonas sp. F29 TaxID=2867247 RepID=UPI001C8356F6|nr:DsrE family protein [Thermosulfurimonas sp. F29]MBX6424079.1 DsrE family protein [Thermosulfurimonas sp. F29]
MKLGIVITTRDPEKAWNAVRLANFALRAGDEVRVFLMGEGVEAPEVDQPPFRVREQLEEFLAGGGEILACGTCLKLREREAGELCPLSTLKDLYEVIRDSDRVVTF